MADVSTYLKSELREAVQQKQALVVVGAGASIGATKLAREASWNGLLESGIEHCTEIRPELANAWAPALRSDLASATDAPTLIRVAQEVQSRLEHIPGNRFARWLERTTGSLEATQHGLLEAIRDLGVPVATTNYDDLLVKTIGGEPVTWLDPAGIQRVCRGQKQGVIHIHGHWAAPESVVLGMDSYKKAMGDERSQTLVRALFATRSVVFIGFGAGLSDPNFAGLRDWATTQLADSDYPMTLLANSHELADAQRYECSALQVVVYGDHFGDLELYLADLARPTAAAPATLDLDYDWSTLQTKLARLCRRVRQDFDPDLVLTMSGPGSTAAYCALASDPDETPVACAVTFPLGPRRSRQARRFTDLAAGSGWHRIRTSTWDIFLPNLVCHLDPGSRILLMDDRAVSGESQRVVAEYLRQLGHEVRRSALAVRPALTDDVDYWEDTTDGNIRFPWGDHRGRS